MHDERHDVLIVGAGNAGVSLTARLMKHGARDVALLDRRQVHRYRPLLNYVGAGEATMATLERAQHDVLPEGATWVQDDAVAVDPDGRTVRTHDGRTLGYDTLVLCPGLPEDWDAVPGLRAAYDAGWAGSTFVDTSAPRVWPALRDLTLGSVVFTVPPEPAPCGATALKPLLMACDHWQRTGVLGDLDVRLVVPYESILDVSQADEKLEPLLGLSVFDARARRFYEETRDAAAVQRRLAVQRVADSVRFGEKRDGGGLVAGRESAAARLSKPASRGLGRAATWAGVGVLGAAVAVSVHPALAHGVDALPGLLTWAGTASLGAGRLFGAPRAAPAQDSSKAFKFPSWLPSFSALWDSARAKAAVERDFEARVGDGAIKPFWAWLRVGASTALSWFLVSLLGMVGGALLTAPLTHGAVASSAGADVVARIPLLTLFNTFGGQQVLTELVLLGLVFNGARELFSRWVSAARATWYSGAVTLLALLAGLMVTGYPLSLAPDLLGVEAVMIALYASTGTLLAPVLARLMFSLMAVESTRLIGYLKVPVAGQLLGLPDWSTLALVALILGALLISPLKRALARVRELGAWWRQPMQDGSPKPLLPMLSAGLAWAVPVYVVGDVALRLLHWVLPQSEPTPEVLRRLLLMPLDVVVFNLLIFAALEEWVFRRGLFTALVNRIKKWGAPSKWWFWPAAIASTLIFSGAHYIDWGALLAHVGLGGESWQRALTGVYAFTWASFLGRAVAGLLLVWLYAASGSLFLPIIAHFGSNTLESLGYRWGPVPFVALAALMILQQLWRAAKPLPISTASQTEAPGTEAGYSRSTGAPTA